VISANEVVFCKRDGHCQAGRSAEPRRDRLHASSDAEDQLCQ